MKAKLSCSPNCFSIFTIFPSKLAWLRYFSSFIETSNCEAKTEHILRVPNGVRNISLTSAVFEKCPLIQELYDVIWELFLKPFSERQRLRWYGSSIKNVGLSSAASISFVTCPHDWKEAVSTGGGGVRTVLFFSIPFLLLPMWRGNCLFGIFSDVPFLSSHHPFTIHC